VLLHCQIKFGIITFCDGLQTIGQRAFYGVSAKIVELPSSVVEIGNRSFWNETQRIILNSTTPPSIAIIPFGTNTNIYVPDDALSAYKMDENWSDFEDNIYPKSQYTIDLSVYGTANCYIVPSEGYYRFNASVKGNSSVSVGPLASSEVLWESFGTDEVPSVGDLIFDVSLKDGYVNFEASNKKGNAVIAVKDASGNILWSWHIWLTDQPEEQVYYNNAGTMMDRNLGATSATPGDVRALGLLYQWGRKDPFLSGKNISNNDRAASTITWPNSEASSDHLVGNITLAYSISHPTTYITSPQISDWLCVSSNYRDNTLWSEEKSAYDPCPPGWSVPKGGSDGIWATALNKTDSYYNGPFDSVNRGYDFGSDKNSSSNQLGSSKIIWYPASGLINNYPCDVGGRYLCWSFTTNDGAYGFLCDDKSYVALYSHARYIAGSVRCCKE